MQRSAASENDLSKIKGKKARPPPPPPPRQSSLTEVSTPAIPGTPRSGTSGAAGVPGSSSGTPGSSSGTPGASGPGSGHGTPVAPPRRPSTGPPPPPTRRSSLPVGPEVHKDLTPSPQRRRPPPPKPPRPGHVFQVRVPCRYPGGPKDMGLDLRLHKGPPGDRPVLLRKTDHGRYEEQIKRSGNQYVTIDGVIPGSAAALSAKVKSGDVLLEVNGKLVCGLDMDSIR